MASGLSRFRLNSHGIQSYLDGDHGVSALVRGEAAKVLAAAQSSAPVESGDYQASLRIEETHTDRLVVRVVADVDYAMVVEAKTGNLARSLP